MEVTIVKYSAFENEYPQHFCILKFAFIFENFYKHTVNLIEAQYAKRIL